MNKQNIRMIVSIVCILAVLAGAFAILDTVRKQNSGTEPVAGTTVAAGGDTIGGTEAPVPAKRLTIQIVFGDGSEKTVPIETDADTLRGALESVEGLVAGSESQYGLFVTTVDGVAADSGKQEWWCFSRGGEMLMTGIDETPISDGETYEVTLKTGY